MAATQPAPAKPPSSTRSYVIWGILAFFAVIATSASITLGIGASRGTFSLAQFSAAPPPPQPVIQRPAAVSEFEVARLRDAIRALSEERDRLNTRVETLEHSVGDITASIKPAREQTPPQFTPIRETEPFAATPIPEAIRPDVSATPAVAAADIEPVVHPVIATAPPSAPPPAIKPTESKGPKAVGAAEAPTPRHRHTPKKITRPSHDPASATPAAPKQHTHAAAKPARTKPLKLTPPSVANAPRPTQVAQVMRPGDITQSTALKTEFGVDLGGEISLDGLRARWASIKGNHGEALKGFQPIVRVREGVKPGTVELHLVAGPVADAGSAARVCASLHHAGIACQTAEYDGQRLSLR